MSFSHITGEKKFREMVIRRHDSTLSIKEYGERFYRGAQFIEKILYYISCVGLIKSVLLNLSSLVGQKENTTVGGLKA